MDEVFNVGKTLLLDGQPMSLVTPAGVEAWIDQGIKYSYFRPTLRSVACF